MKKLTLALATLLAVGCGGLHEPPPVGSGTSSLRGDMGDVVGFSGTAFDHDIYRWDSYSTHIETRVRAPGGVAMAMVDFYGGTLGEGELSPGARFTVRGWDYAYDEETGDYVEPVASVTGCSGPSDNEWYFDQGADEVDFEIYEGLTPGSLQIDFSARFVDDYAGRVQTVVGSVTYDPALVTADPYGSGETWIEEDWDGDSAEPAPPPAR